MTVPQISVVVPFYNNEDLLGDCLQSIAAQTFTDLEVIMVDDGSSDGSAGIAQEMSGRGPEVPADQGRKRGSRLCPQPGHRAGPRRVPRVRGRGRHAADSRLRAAARHAGATPARISSRVTCCGSARLACISRHCTRGPSKAGGSVLTSARRRSFSTTSRCGTSCSGKSFWDRAGLTYPEGMLWEDLQVMTRAHVLARAVDVIPEPIYYWRERGKGALSITQSRTDISNFRDRITALLAIDSFLASQRHGQAAPPASAQGPRQRPLALCLRSVPDQRQPIAPSSSTWPASTWIRSTSGCWPGFPPPTSSPTTWSRQRDAGQAHRVQQVADRAAGQDHPGGPEIRPAPRRPAVPRGRRRGYAGPGLPAVLAGA